LFPEDSIQAVRCVSNHYIPKWEYKRANKNCKSLWSSSQTWGKCKRLNFKDALSFCESVGGRLPTLKEAKDGCVAGSDCSFDSHSIWISTTSRINYILTNIILIDFLSFVFCNSKVYGVFLNKFESHIIGSENAPKTNIEGIQSEVGWFELKFRITSELRKSQIKSLGTNYHT